MRIFICILLLPALLSGQSPSKKIRALFIGNSYTHVNNLPVLVASLAIAKGDTLIHDNYTPGGYSLNNHYNDPACIAKIAQGNWQYVILQAQSQEPSFSPTQVNNQTLPYAVKLDSVIKKYNPCVTTVFYETWGRKNGDQGNCGFYPPVCTYTGMQNRLRDSYRLFADTTKAVIAPVGEAFRASISGNPTLDLYQVDESHPSLAGSYLAAAVFYETLFQKSVGANTYDPGLGASTSLYLQQKAHAIVHDSLVTWHQGIYHPWASFAAQATGMNVQFTSNSSALTNKWYFGDGNTSLLAHPTHLYAAAGTYTISHVVTDGCKKDSALKTMLITNAVGNKGHSKNSENLTWPNPVGNELYLPGSFYSSDAHLSIHTLTGKLMHEGNFQAVIDLSSYAPGIYILTVRTGSQSTTHKFVKEKN